LAEFDKIGKSTSHAGEYPLVGEDEVVGVTLNGDPYRRNMYSFQLGTGGSSNHAIVVPVYEMHVAILGHNTRLLDLSNPLTGSLDWWIENRIDWALQTLRISRSAYGSLSNAMDHVVSNLANQSMNLAVLQSNINDADFALETTNLAKQQIMVQAGTAMLAQANASKSSVLALLQA
jgi:flagellin